MNRESFKQRAGLWLGFHTLAVEEATGNACPLDHKAREQAPAFDPGGWTVVLLILGQGVYGDTVASMPCK